MVLILYYLLVHILFVSYLQWQAISLTVIEKVQIAAAVLGSLFLIASILAGLVLTQPISQVATAGPALPDLLRHVRLHGPGVHR